MRKVPLKALKKIGSMQPGDTFERGRTDANILCALGVAEEIVTDEGEGLTRRRRRAYKRRDMTAEE